MVVSCPLVWSTIERGLIVSDMYTRTRLQRALRLIAQSHVVASCRASDCIVSHHHVRRARGTLSVDPSRALAETKMLPCPSEEGVNTGFELEALLQSRVTLAGVGISSQTHLFSWTVPSVVHMSDNNRFLVLTHAFFSALEMLSQKNTPQKHLFWQLRGP